MDIKHKERPSEFAVANYQNKVQKLLSAHKLSITINLVDEPYKITSSIDNDKIIEYF